MTPEQAARRWQQTKIARQRRDVELETFPTTAGSDAKTSHPMFGTGRPASPARARLPGLVTQPTAPAGMTSWGTRAPAPIEHVGGGFHLLACNLMSQDEEWYGPNYARFAIAVWLIRPDGTISDPWLSPGNTHRPYTSGPDDAVAVNAPPYGEPTELCMPKLTRWQEGALLTFASYTDERQYVNDLAGFWPQVEGSEFDFDFGVPGEASVYRWIGHDGTDPVIGPAFELYAGSDGDFPTSGDWDIGDGVTEFDDGIVEGLEVIGPSADTNIVIYGETVNSRRHRAWLLDKNPADNSLSLAQRTTFTDGQVDGNPGGLTRVSADRWVVMSSPASKMQAALFNAKTGVTLDSADFDIVAGFASGSSDAVDCHYIASSWGYHAGNHLHFDGQAVFAGWAADLHETSQIAYRHATLTFDGDTLTVGDITEWAVEPRIFAFAFHLNSERWVETCEGCLRLIHYIPRETDGERTQALFERREVKAGISPAPSPELAPDGGYFVDQRLTPTSHPAGFMWSSNIALGDPWDGFVPQIPQLVRHPA